MPARRSQVIIVGAGLAGLSCAVHARRLGMDVKVLEASDRPGGRVATDVVDGFRIDRGFQVLLDSYPELQRLELAPALGLRPFEPGALLAADGRLQSMLDPWRRPLSALGSALSGPGTLQDKLTVAVWRREAVAAGPGLVETLPEMSTRERLAEIGVGDEMIDRFFRPFFGGVFLDLELETSSRMLDFLFPLFATGSACLPRQGMAALPAALAERLPAEIFEFGARVRSVAPGRVELEDGEPLEAETVIVATEADVAARLLPGRVPERSWRACCCAWFAADRDPVGEPTLVLDADGNGPVTNLAVTSTVNPELAPAGGHLIAAAIVGNPRGTDADVERDVREQLEGWFGWQVNGWRMLKLNRILQALPAQAPGSLTPWQRPVEVEPGLLACGDWLDNPSIDGALASGRRAAEAAQARARSAA